MAVSYEEAAEIIRAHFGPGWTHGTFCLDDRFIVENDEFYVFEVGAREDLVDGNPDYAIVGGVPVIYKSDGHIESRASVTIATDPTIRGRPNPHPTLNAIGDALRTNGQCYGHDHQRGQDTRPTAP